MFDVRHIPMENLRQNVLRTQAALKGSAMHHSVHKPLHPGHWKEIRADFIDSVHKPLHPGRWELIKANMVVHAHELYPHDEARHKALITGLLGMEHPHKVRADAITWEAWSRIVLHVHEHVSHLYPTDKEKSHKLELKLLGYI
jgi:hypothetical protein